MLVVGRWLGVVGVVLGGPGGGSRGAQAIKWSFRGKDVYFLVVFRVKLFFSVDTCFSADLVGISCQDAKQMREDTRRWPPLASTRPSWRQFRAAVVS